MDRAMAEIKMKQLIVHNKDYKLSELYDEAKDELVWECRLCLEHEFMVIDTFSTWIRKWDWIEKIGSSRNKTVRYRRIDVSTDMSDLYGPAMKKLDWRKYHTWQQ